MNVMGQLLLAVVLLIQGRNADEKYMGLRTLKYQPGAPLQGVSALFNDDQLSLLLVNVSDRPVTQAAFGLILEDGAGVVPAATRLGKPCNAVVPPNGFLVVTAEHDGFDTAPAYFADKGITRKDVTVGLVRARYDDGTEWTYDLNAKTGFVQKDDQAAQAKIERLRKAKFGEDPHAASGPLFGGYKGDVARCEK